jgi:TRAP-type C4-dicarboxylate transport system permease large subunit
MMAVFIEMAVVTPPMGLNLFIIHGVSGESDMGLTIRGAVPFFLCMLGVMLILIYFPDLAVYLPRKMFVF